MRGFTLQEALVTMFLLSVVFVAAGDLARDLSGFHRVQSDETRIVVAAREALNLINRQARSAARLVAGLSSLTLELPDPAVALYPALPAPTTLPAGWRPNSPRITRQYLLSGNQLQLLEGARTTLLLDQVAGFSATVNGQTLTLELSWQQQNRVRSLRRKTFLPLRSEP